MTAWVVEPADPGVGIFGESVAHQTCDTEGFAELVSSNIVRVADGVETGEDVWECECGARVAFEWSQPAEVADPDSL